MHRRAVVLPFLCALLLLLAGVPAAAQPAPLAGFDTSTHAAIREWNVPGLAVSVVKDGKGVFEQGFGVRDELPHSIAVVRIRRESAPSGTVVSIEVEAGARGSRLLRCGPSTDSTP